MSQPKKTKGKAFKIRPVVEESADPLTSRQDAAPEAFEQLGELPHSYGADTIFLVAQEPHWLFTYWDINIGKHPGGVAFLRYYPAGAEMEGEIEVPFEARNWYIPVQQAATEYYVEIGFYRDKKWNSISRSVPATTPPEGVATSESFNYATVPFHLSFHRLIDRLKNSAKSGENLLSVVARLQQAGDFSAFASLGFLDLLSENQRELLSARGGAALSSWAQAALTSWSSSEVSSWFTTAATTSWSGASETLSSFGGERGFFMHLNAEVIFYGGTDSRATVTIDAQPVSLNPDGTFRHHFLFPDADHEIPIVATSPDGMETRSATLRFLRSTGKIGGVTDTPQPPLCEPMGRKSL